MEVAPLRSLDDFVLAKARFQVPELGDGGDKWFNRLVYNLMFYQTNYLFSSMVIFLLVFFFKPHEMFAGLTIMIICFGGYYIGSGRQPQLRSFKKDHPLVVTLLCFSLGYYLVYKITSIYVFVLGILLPILFTIVHASLRQRNITNKLTNASNVLGLSKKTPMGYILECIGLEPNFKYQ